MPEFAFDCTLTTAIRVTAATEAEARAMLRAEIDSSEANLGHWPNGDPILCEVSLALGPVDLYEVDGDPLHVRNQEYKMIKSYTGFSDEEIARQDALYANEPWAKLAIEAGFRPYDTESAARDAFRFCADKIAKLEAELHPETGYADWVNPVEAKIINGILDRALAKGYEIAVFFDDDPDPAVGPTKDLAKIKTEIAATGTTTLRFYFNGKYVGWIWLVHGNGEDVVSDYSNNDAMKELVGDDD